MSTNVLAGAVSDDSGIRTRWMIHAGLAALLLLALGAAFSEDIVHTVEVWWIYPAYSHCFLVIPISAWLIWEKRDHLRFEAPMVSPMALVAAPLFGLMWLVGYYATIAEVREVAIIGLVQVAFATMFGLALYRQLLFPMVFLFFLVPTGEYLIPPLQRFTADFTQHGLDLFGVIYYREGTLFQLQNGQYEVAEACAGLRFLIATVTLGALFSYLMFRKWWKIVLFLAASFIVPIIGNGIRVLATIAVANYTNNRVAAGMDHIVYGWGFAVAIIFVILYIGSWFRDPIADESPNVAGEPPARMVETPTALAGAFVVALVLLVPAPAFAWWQETHVTPPNTAALVRPLAAPGWSIGEVEGSWRPAFGAPDAQLAVSMQRSEIAAPVDLLVGYFDQSGPKRSVLAAKARLWDPTTNWHSIATARARARLSGRDVAFTETTITNDLEQRLLWSCYWANGEFTQSGLGLKLLELRGALFGRPGVAIVVVSTPITGSTEDARQRLTAALAATTDLASRLDQTSARSR